MSIVSNKINTNLGLDNECEYVSFAFSVNVPFSVV